MAKHRHFFQNLGKPYGSFRCRCGTLAVLTADGNTLRALHKTTGKVLATATSLRELTAALAA